jgi:hypothetical protein
MGQVSIQFWLALAQPVVKNVNILHMNFTLSEFLAANPEVAGSIPGAIRVSE